VNALGYCDRGVTALGNFAGVVALLAQEKNYRLAFSSVEKKCRTL
jgi:hypothetical protein